MDWLLRQQMGNANWMPTNKTNIPHFTSYFMRELCRKAGKADIFCFLPVKMSVLCFELLKCLKLKCYERELNTRLYFLSRTVNEN